MQESDQQEEVIQYIPSKKFVFHTCPICESLAAFPEESKLPSFFDKIAEYLLSLKLETIVEESK